MKKTSITLFFVVLASTLLAGCLVTNQTGTWQNPLLQNRVWVLIATSNTMDFSYDPYSLYREGDGSWGLAFLGTNKINGAVSGPSSLRINCNRNSYSDNGPRWGTPGYEQAFVPIPPGSVMALVKERLCGTTWAYDKKIYHFLVSNSDKPPTDIWIRGNEVRYRGNLAELIVAYSNAATGTASPVQVTVNCTSRVLTEFDLIRGEFLGVPYTAQENTAQIGALLFDRACNERRNFMVRQYEDKQTSTQTAPSSALRRDAERRCEELGISRGTQPFNVCVTQLSR